MIIDTVLKTISNLIKILKFDNFIQNELLYNKQTMYENIEKIAIKSRDSKKIGFIWKQNVSI